MTEVRIAEGTFEEGYYAVGVQKLKSSSSYDAMGRQTHQVDWLGAGSNSAFDRTVTYNASGQVATETTVTKQWNSNFTSLDYYTNATTNYYGSGSGYDLGALEHSVTTNTKGSTLQSTITTTNSYSWWDGPAQASINIVTNPVSGSTTNYTTPLSYTAAGQLSSSYIADGRPRSVTFVTDMAGQVIRRDEADNNSTTGDPHEIWYRYGGRQIGYTGNNSSLESDYKTTIEQRINTPFLAGDAPFRFGASTATSYADFGQSLDPINSYSQGSGGGSYTVRAGDTLQSVAAAIWGDSSLWYRLAEANGLSGGSALSEGQRLTLPAGVLASGHSASTFKPYDAAAAMGELSPTTAKPPKRGGCGMMGQILIMVIAVAIAVALPHIAPAIFAATGALGVAGPMAAAAIASAASQGGAIATGQQAKFSLKRSEEETSE